MFELPYEAVDAITKKNIEDCIDQMIDELLKAEQGKAWLHEEDKIRYRGEYIPAFNAVIEYFGGQPRVLP